MISPRLWRRPDFGALQSRLGATAVIVAAALAGWASLQRVHPTRRQARSTPIDGLASVAAARHPDPSPLANDGAPPPPANQTMERTLVQRASDFRRGCHGDAIVDDALRLRSSATGSRVLAGSYSFVADERPLSPQEQMEATFNRISFSCDADVPPGAMVKLEFRILTYDEDGEGWSEWREVPAQNLNRFTTFTTLVQRWEYRLTLAAPDAAATPVVRSVTIATERDPELAARTFAFAAQP